MEVVFVFETYFNIRKKAVFLAAVQSSVILSGLYI